MYPLILAVAIGAAGVHSTKVFRGPNGMKVAVVRLKPLADKRAVVKVSASDTEMDDLVVLHEIEDDGGRQDYYATLPAGKHVTISVRDDQFLVHLPGRRAAAKLVFDEKLTEATKGEEIAALAPPPTPTEPAAPPVAVPAAPAAPAPIP